MFWECPSCGWVEPYMQMRVRCQRCGREFAVLANSFVCPACGVADVRLASGDEVILESIEVEE